VAENGINVCVLGQMDKVTRVIMFDLNAKRPVQLSKVSDLKVLAEAGLEFIDKADGIRNDCAIIHMHHHNSELALGDDHLEVDSLVHTALSEPKGLEHTRKLLVPMVTRLLKPVEYLDKVQNVHAGIRGFVAQEMLYVEDFIVLELAIEVCTLDIYLVHLEAKTVGHCNDSTHGRKFGHQCISVIIVNTADLAEC